MEFNKRPSSKWLLPKFISNNDIPLSKIPKPLLAVLHRRGLDNIDKINNFINPPSLPKLEDHFPDLTKAINRLKRAVINKEKIAICGDYDADGMTSSILLADFFNRLNIDVSIWIPDRLTDGYGLNEKMIYKLNQKNIKLIITVDNGVSASRALNYAEDLNIDVIVSDHHKIPTKLSNIYALIHTENTPKESPYRYLAGVGLAYVIAKQLSQVLNNDNAMRNSLDYFCIGTVADMTILKGANRFLLKQGLQHLSKNTSKGLAKLIENAGLINKKITSQDIAFKIAPRINSIGRISNPDLIISLMLEDNDHKINYYASCCEELNKKRKEICTSIEKEVHEILLNEDSNIKSFILVSRDHWHSGVIGIVASRVVEIHCRPTAILTKDENGLFRGSARSSPGFDMIGALDSCKDLFESYGGHKAAAGFSIKYENIPKLEKELIKFADEYSPDFFIPNISPEAYICFNEIDDNFYKSQSKLEPFGIGNPKPLFWTRGVRVRQVRAVKNKYFFLKLEHSNIIINAVDWNPEQNYYKNQLLDIIFNVEMNYWKNSQNLQLNIIESRNYQNYVTIKVNDNSYNCYLKGDNIIKIVNKKGKSITSNDNLADIYSGNDVFLAYVDSLIEMARVALGKAI